MLLCESPRLTSHFNIECSDQYPLIWTKRPPSTLRLWESLHELKTQTIKRTNFVTVTAQSISPTKASETRSGASNNLALEIALPIVLGLVLISAIVWWLWRRRKAHRSGESEIYLTPSLDWQRNILGWRRDVRAVPSWHPSTCPSQRTARTRRTSTDGTQNDNVMDDDGFDMGAGAGNHAVGLTSTKVRAEI